MTRNMRIKGPCGPKSPVLKGEIRFGYNDDSFKVKGPLDESLKTIIKKYGIRPEQLYSVTMVAMATIIVGFSAFNTVCISIV